MCRDGYGVGTGAGKLNNLKFPRKCLVFQNIIPIFVQYFQTETKRVKWKRFYRTYSRWCCRYSSLGEYYIICIATSTLPKRDASSVQKWTCGGYWSHWYPLHWAMWYVDCAGSSPWSRWVIVPRWPTASIPSSLPMRQTCLYLVWARCRAVQYYQWLTCAAKSELWLKHHLTPNLRFHNTVQVKFHNYYES